MKPRITVLLETCIEEGVAAGYRKAHKHQDAPSEDVILDNISTAIMGRIYEWFTFADDDL